MEAADAADTIAELTEEREQDAERNRFRNRTALLIAVLGAILAICATGGDNAKDETQFNNIKASDAWAFYQAKNVRQTQYKLAADSLRRDLTRIDAASPEGRAIAADLKTYEDTVTRYENEPDHAKPSDPTAGDGKRQLSARAKAFEAAREHAEARNNAFDLAQMLLQLAIVLGSVSILALSKGLRLAAALIGVAGAVMTVNGYFLLFVAPF